MLAFIAPCLPSRPIQPCPSGIVTCAAQPPIRSVILLAAAATLFTQALPADAALFHFAAPRPTESLGLGGGDRYLKPCPSTPNCITTSGDAYDSHFVPPWMYDPVSMAEAITQLKTILNDFSEQKVTILEDRKTSSDVGEGHYIATEFETPTFGFVDDVEFFFVPDGKSVEYRSASRIGRDDLKANRKRIKALRVQLQEKYGWRSQGYN